MSTTEDRRPKLPLAALASACLTGFAAAQAGSADVEAARATLDQWVETRRLISKETSEWLLGKEAMADRAQIVRQEIQALRTRIEDAKKSTTEVEQKQRELREENERLRAATAVLAETLVTLEARTAALLPRLPDPIRERVKPLSQRLPAAGETSKLSLGERFGNVVGILNELNKFQRDITIVTEVRPLGDGSSAQVSTIYLGLGLAWYVGGDGKVAGVGAPGKDGWLWLAANDAGVAVAKAIAVQKNEQVASFVHLPVRIQ
jgi:hypothetical protein